MADHSTLLEAHLHENKGVSTATNNSVATASGGATVWQKVKANNIDTSSIFNTNVVHATVYMADISTAGTVYFYVPFAGTLSSVGSVLGGAIATANSTITIKDNSGATAGTITVAYSGSAAGDIDSVALASNNTFTAGQRVIIETDGASSNTVPLFLTLTFTVTG